MCQTFAMITFSYVFNKVRIHASHRSMQKREMFSKSLWVKMFFSTTKLVYIYIRNEGILLKSSLECGCYWSVFSPDGHIYRTGIKNEKKVTCS